MRPIFLASTLIVSFMVSIPTQAAVTGTLMTPEGTAVAGARVALYPIETPDLMRARVLARGERKPLATGQSDSNGNFSLETKVPYAELRAEAPGKEPLVLAVAADDELGAVPLKTAPNKSGVVTANGKPLAGAVVTFDGAENDFTATTDEKGRYTAPDPATWAGSIRVVHPDFAVLDEAFGRQQFGRANVASTSLDRTLVAGESIKGKVLAADGTTPVAKASVLVDNWPLGTTADDGTFTIAHAPAHWTMLQARSGEMVALQAHPPSNATAPLTLKLQPGSRISGSLRDVAAKTAVAGASLRLGGTASAPSFWTTTDAKGAFSFTGVPTGTYNLGGEAPGISISGLRVTIPGSGQSLTKAMAATRQARITGNVVDEDRKPVAGAGIGLRRTSSPEIMAMMRGNESSTAVSGPDGRFVLRNVATDQDFSVQATRKGYPSASSSSLRLAAGERRSGVSLTIPRGTPVSGRVTDKNGVPVAGAVVSSNDSNSGGRGGGMFVLRGQNRQAEGEKTAADGTFTIRLREGTYDLAFQHEGFATKTLRAQQVHGAVKPLEVVLEPGVELTGRIVRKGGIGIEGVNVALMGEGLFSNAVSAADGSFKLGDLTPGEAMLNASKPDEYIQQIRPVSVPAHDVTIEIPAGVRVSGHVVDKSSGDPITTFQAGLSSTRGGGGMVFNGPSQMRSFTSPDGSFVLENVPAGAVQVNVTATGYAPGKAANLNAEEGKGLDNVQVALEAAVHIVGKVTAPDGSPLAGVSVAQEQNGPMRGMRLNIGGAGGAQVATDANGEYTLDGLDRGEKSITFNHTGYLAESKTVTLSDKETRLDVQMSSGTVVNGYVRTDSGAPVSDAAVRASSAADSSFARTARTDAGGAFHFEGLTPGHYEFSASKSGYAPGLLRDFDIASGMQPVVTLQSGGTIYGHVTGLTDSELTQTTVVASSVSGNASGAVDSSGNYRIEGAPIGTARISANSGRGLMGGRTTAPQTVEVTAGSPVQADIEFKSDVSIRGRVTRNGRPVTGANVMFVPRGGSGTQNVGRALTSSDGSYQVVGLEDGSYNVQMRDMEGAATLQYDVHGSGTFDITLRTNPVRGRVLDAGSGQPIEGATVELVQTTADMFPQRAIQTDASGAFVLDNIAAGTYHLRAAKSDYGQETIDVNVGDSAPQDVELKLTPSSGVRLRVIDARDGRLLNAMVHVTDQQGAPITDNGSRFGGAADEIRLTLAPGTYLATISAENYASQTVTISSPSQRDVPLTPGGMLMIHSTSSTPVRARLLLPNGTAYTPGGRFASTFTLYAAPGTTTIENVAAGMYRLQTLDANDRVLHEVAVTVVEGQTASPQI
jgi:protocatechuate 3,4-dioxygenase beta subunit